MSDTFNCKRCGRCEEVHPQIAERGTTPAICSLCCADPEYVAEEAQRRQELFSKLSEGMNEMKVGLNTMGHSSAR